MTIQSFEDFLKDKHGEDYIGTNDDMPDGFDSWLSELDVDDLIHYGNMYGLKLLKQKIEEETRQIKEKLLALTNKQNV